MYCVYTAVLCFHKILKLTHKKAKTFWIKFARISIWVSAACSLFRPCFALHKTQGTSRHIKQSFMHTPLFLMLVNKCTDLSINGFIRHQWYEYSIVKFHIMNDVTEILLKVVLNTRPNPNPYYDKSFIFLLHES